MAKYKYFCSECKERKEVKGGPEHDTPNCDECGEKMSRDFTAEGPPGISFKGSGFHVNDYD